MKKAVSGAAKWKYFDDCAICGAMRKAEQKGQGLSLEELRGAFREANKRQSEAGKKKA